ncbi:MAG: TldD/PmbA family protein [Bdellovibrionota bacterium]
MTTFNIKKALGSIDLKGADWFGIREVHEKTTLRKIRDGHPELNYFFESTGWMVEVLVDGQFGYSASSERTSHAVQRAAERACEQARLASKWGIHKFSKEQRPSIQGKYVSPRIKGTMGSGRLTASDQNQILAKISKNLKISDKIIRTVATLREVSLSWRYVSSSGADLEQEFMILLPFYASTARDGAIVQTRTNGGWDHTAYQTGFEILDDPFLWEKVQKVAEQSLELIAAEDCPTEATNLVIMPDQMMLQIHESIGHPLEVDRILGDERNYAGSSFVKLSDFGNLVYGSPLMNITFDPTVPGELASYAYDDSGMAAKREYIIREGVLLRGLGGLESQARSGVPGVANFRASSWNRPPVDRMANLNLEPGTTSYNELIGSVEKGVVMWSNRSWSIDDYRNKFQFGCEFAQKIENGKLTKVLKNPNYRGITVPFWRGLKKVGNKDTYQVYGTPHCGKAEPNQSIRVGHASPVCLFENVEVFGGGA